MSGPEESDNGRNGDGSQHPTASFDGSAPEPGTQIGAFRIERELGRGAMGVVYLAHDTKLDRPVAIKSLSAGVLDNPAARSRFTREARVLASLSHPGIAAIYDEVQQVEGPGHLVLEYVEGQTLAERIAADKLSVEESLSIARQIAEAVAAAHDSDVIHRDLKPGNIKITPEGSVKVLDFGLAKTVGDEAPEKLSTVTEPGRVIGTPAYMSPEQARGKPIDKRTDIWAFGCVLFEMLTGKVAFEGETASDTLANVLQSDPDWEALPEETPRNIVILLRRCLQKDPRQRLRDLGDAAIELRETPAVASGAPIESHSPRHTLWKVIAASVAIGLVTGGIVMLAILKAWTGPSTRDEVGAESRHVRRFPVALDQENPLMAGGGRGSVAPSFTRDGRKMIYTVSSGGETWVAVRSMDSLVAQRVRGTDGAIWAAASPSGQWLVFVTPRDTWRVPLAGGPPERIADAVAFVWEDENTLICRPIMEPAGLYRLDIKTGQMQPLSLPPTRGNIALTQPIQFDQRSRTLFYTSLGSQVSTSAAFAFSMDTGENRLLVERASAAWYVPSGHLVYVQPGRLAAVPFNIDTLEVTGTAVDVTEERMATDEGVPRFAFSPDGTLAYVPIKDSQDADRDLVWVDTEGRETLLGTRPMGYRSVSVSPDANRHQVIGDVSPEGSIWIYDTEGESPVRSLTLSSEGFCWSPVWVPPDNREVVFCAADEKRGCVLKLKDAGGSGQAREIFHLAPGSTDWLFLLPKSFKPDGKVLLATAFGTIESTKGMDIVVLDMEPGVEARPLLASEFDEHSPVLSPDGKWLAFVSDESGRDEVFVSTFPDVGSKWQVSVETEGGWAPLWAPDGTAIYYRDGTSVVSVKVDTKDGFKSGRAQRLFDDIYLSTKSSHDYDVHPSGKQFIMIKKGPQDFAPTEVIIVENWFEELKRRVPSDQN